MTVNPTASSPPPTPTRVRGFRASVGVETPPSTFTWHGGDWVALFSIPAIFTVGPLVGLVTQDPILRIIADTSLRILLFVILVIANRTLLARHWRAFWTAPWRSVGIVLSGMVIIQIVATLLNNVLRPFGSSNPTEQQPVISAALAVMLFASLNPMATALIEDFTFRHTLLLKFPVWDRLIPAAALTLGNALAFGAVHINNFDGQWLLTLSYAGVGLVMNLTYLWTRNIWHVLLIHGLHNFILCGPFTMLFIHALGGEIGGL